MEPFVHPSMDHVLVKQGGMGWTARLTAPVERGVWAVTCHVCVVMEAHAMLLMANAHVLQAGEETDAINIVRTGHMDWIAVSVVTAVMQMGVTPQLDTAAV